MKNKFLEQRLGFDLSELLKFPKYFHIETIDMCNARCVMCGIDFDKKESTTMSDELFTKIVTEISPWKDHIEKVMPYLDGEPLLDRKIFERVKELKSAGIKWVNIATNASLLSDGKIAELLDSGLDEVYITIDSMNKEIYEQIRIGLNFDRVLERTLNLIEARNKSESSLRIRIQMVRQDLNHTEVNEFIKYWKAKLKDSDQIVIQNAHNWGNKVEVKKFGDESKVNDKPCIALWGTFVAHLNGEVPLCCIDTETEYKVGDLNESSIEQIWQNNHLKKYRELHEMGNRERIPICNGCTLWRDDKRDIVD
jgi:radical SAM protein with 4Fe4S-binding SPASM domain